MSVQTDHVAAVDWDVAARTATLPGGVFVGGEERPAVGDRRRAVHPPRDEIALLVSLEMGKPIRHAWEIELRALIQCLEFYGGLADEVMGEIPPTVEGQLALVTRAPAGVVAAVVPWNFPLTIGSWKFAPALAAGCTVVLKTAEQSPLSMQRVAAVGVEAGLPPGVFTVLSGDGTVVGSWVNCYEEGDMSVPFGGVKLSGNGRDKSRHALEEYTNLKTTLINHG